MAEGPTTPDTGTPPPRRDVASRVRQLAPYAIGAAVMLLVVLLAGPLLSPKTTPLTEGDVDQAIADALASVTPPPARAQLVYQAVQPSLVLIETTGVKDAPESEDGEPTGLGSGVVVTQDGDILTSLHVVEDATTIDLTFFDGSTSPGEIVVEAARERHRGRPRARTAGRPRSRPRSATRARSSRGPRSTRSARRSACTARCRPASSPASTARSTCRARTAA